MRRIPHSDRVLADVLWCPLSLRRRLRSNFGLVRPCYSALPLAANRKSEIEQSKIEMAEGVRFELTRPFGLPVFKTGAINRSATPPENW